MHIQQKKVLQVSHNFHSYLMTSLHILCWASEKTASESNANRRSRQILRLAINSRSFSRLILVLYHFILFYANGHPWWCEQNLQNESFFTYPLNMHIYSSFVLVFNNHSEKGYTKKDSFWKFWTYRFHRSYNILHIICLYYYTARIFSFITKTSRLVCI